MGNYIHTFANFDTLYKKCVIYVMCGYIRACSMNILRRKIWFRLMKFGCFFYKCIYGFIMDGEISLSIRSIEIRRGIAIIAVGFVRRSFSLLFRWGDEEVLCFFLPLSLFMIFFFISDFPTFQFIWVGESNRSETEPTRWSANWNNVYILRL